MDLKTWFENEIAPRVRADGGWLDIKETGEGGAEITARGECAHCAALDGCLRWVREKAVRDLGREIVFSVTREPFLWRK